MAEGVSKICVVCGKDVGQIKRVKDPQGKYYCEPCYAEAKAQAPTASAARIPAAPPAPAKAPAPPPPPRMTAPVAASSADDELMLKDEPAKGKLPFVPPECIIEPPDEVDDDPESEEAAGESDELKLPEKCPACGTRVIRKSQLCVGCQRDMTKMDTLAAIIADGAKQDSTKKIGKIIGRTVGVIGGLVILGIIAFIVSGHFTTPGDPFGNYPTAREKLVRDFFSALAEGGDKGTDKAFNLVSVRETGMVNSAAETFKAKLLRFSEDLNTRLGAGWNQSIKIAFPAPDPYYGDEVLAEVTVGEGKKKEVFHIGMQAQISQEQAVKERHLSPKKKTPHREDGKTRWGIGRIVENPLVEDAMVQMYRPGSDAPDEEPMH